ncbi:colicin D domain-containing protein [Campylobacter concisus]|uniref:colicin D domain-containing protein n=1 Tax=Campylobacter concisus TaxID=199 RepID=UPI001900C793|nr:colicin D domain-containing protein [Campylobacter concisus]
MAKNFVDSVLSDHSSINYRNYHALGENIGSLGAVGKVGQIAKNSSKLANIGKNGDNIVKNNKPSDTKSATTNSNNNGNNWNNNGNDGMIVAEGSEVVNKNIDIVFKDSQLQKKLKHAGDFDLPTKYTKENLLNFKEAIKEHMNATTTTKIHGTYRGQQVTHYLDKKTGLNVIIDNKGEFLSTWKLNNSQLNNLINRGSL